jgi:hypothetical protein
VPSIMLLLSECGMSFAVWEGNRGVKLMTAASRVAVVWSVVASGVITDYVPMMVIATIRNKSSCSRG